MQYRVPDEHEARIIRENGMDPEKVAVSMTGKDFINLIVYTTRDQITIRKGDRKW